MVDPKILCRNHLLGEHHETHMFVGTINKGINITGYIDGKLLEVHSLRSRHDSLVLEMKCRGYNHNSPLAEFDSFESGSICVEDNLIELQSRCEECKRRINVGGV